MLSEINQAERDKCDIISDIYMKRFKKWIQKEQTGGCKRGGWIQRNV